MTQNDPKRPKTRQNDLKGDLNQTKATRNKPKRSKVTQNEAKGTKATQKET